MATRELGTLESVNLTDIWSNEPNFTQWLARNLDYLEAAVNMKLLVKQPEHRLSGAGQVDILAKEVNSGYHVVIENQFTDSDNDHFARLIGYAASRDAKFLIWIAPHFWKWHLDMLNWLNNDGVAIFAVKVSACRIGEAYAPLFEKVVGPDDQVNLADTTTDSGPNIFARFYRPLTAELRREGILAISGRQGGFTGRYRRFRSKALLEDAGITYYSQLQWGERNCRVGLLFSGEDCSKIYDVLYDRRNELDSQLDYINVQWQRSDLESYICAETSGIPDQKDETLEAIRKWMKETLLRLRSTFEPELEKIIVNSLQSSTDLLEEQSR